ncbi:MAG: hypothetical protein Q8J89_09630 [Caulobacter sp.]|nr:hypothetical protein [Caulobacter sp.]
MRVVAAAAVLVLAATSALAQSTLSAPRIKPGPLTPPPRVTVAPLPVCDLVIHDMAVRFPKAKKRPYIDIVVRNNGEAPCGAPPDNGYNIIVVGELYIESFYRNPVSEGGALGFTTLKLIAHQNDRQIPDFSQSLKQLETLGPGHYANFTISTPNGYCVEPDPKCVADYAKFNLRADVRFWAGGKPRISKPFVKSSTVMAN